MNGTRKEPTARAKERAALPAGKAQRERGTFVRIIGEVDRPFLLIVIALLCIGSVMVFSASYAYGKFYFNDSYYFARRQLGWAVLGLAGMCFTAVFVDYRWIKRFAWLGYGVALLLNAAVVVMGIAAKGAQRWLKLGPIQFQPSELLKFFVIIVCASYISNNHSRMKEFRYGILPFILTSVYGTARALLLGVPVGLMTAIFLAKAAPLRLAAVIRTAVQLLAGIPSVVYGLVGMIVLVPAIRRAFGLGSGACLLAAILVLTVMVLPSIINVAETALQAVPREYEEASLALGATETETYFRVSLPAARSGVAAAVVLGVGRAIGEAMAIIMVAGNVANMPGLFTSVRFLTTAIASEMSYASVGSLQRQALFSIGLVLFLFIMLINVFLNVCIKRKKEN